MTAESLSDVSARHRRVAWVVEAVERVLSDRGEPMQAKEVHVAVEAALGKAVSWSSVKNALASGVSGPSRRFDRVATGRYRLTEHLRSSR
jgi:HB1, ASXL, restriction endonuclease HTH domain